MKNGGKRPGAGRPKGSITKSTKDAILAKEALIKAYLENIKPINEALIKKAKAGDMVAIKELHDRVYGRSMQPMELEAKGNIILTFDPTFKDASSR